ncbi:uncharacterized protein LTR77_003964 [Saxophila tyrrhenica]|uniref:Something about silencing protein 4 domain-containing protein n=1 Tax=Saxophila tyrrhenica TaxID=1690608 RepID=A0AAV9PFC9_9PEZI|nr:hypothetical protein LTR77_003964 [Saxophila tyrrhenica]
MAILSRSRTSRETTQHDRHSTSANRQSTDHDNHINRPRYTASPTPPTSDDEDGRPAKKRKLSIRNSKQQQQTLDHHFLPHQSAPPKPPNQVKLTQPHGQLLETLNGVRTVLDTTEDDLSLSLPKSGVATPKSTTRVSTLTPQPQPANAPPKQEDKRTLRSQDDGPRLKSELAIYFPNYEDVIFEVPREEDFLTIDTTLYIADDALKQVKQEQASPGAKKAVKGTPSSVRNGTANRSQYPATPQRSNSNQYNGSPSLNLDLISRTIPDNPVDPLSDDHYSKSHKRAERKEKQLRNIEKERAMHEKVQLDRLLAGLQGHDWLKILGITGITDGEAKKFEPKRDFFIAEVKALVDKFRQWKEQEKKQRLDKEAALAAREDEADESDADSVGPPSSDLNASAARQLQQETASALKSSTTIKLSSKSRDTPKSQPAYLPPPEPEVPITSFYAKRHLREAALGKSRHGRNVTAFGHPLPEMGEREFELPGEYLTAETLRANARERRRRKRGRVAEGGGE